MCQHKAPHRAWLPGPNELDEFAGMTMPEPATLFDDYQGRGPAAATQEMSVAHHLAMAYDLQCPTDESERYFKAYQNSLKRMSEAQRQRFLATFEAENAAFRNSPPTDPKALVRWKYQRYIKNYLRCVVGVDRSVGQLLDYLDANGLANNTVVVYSSDQGFYLGDHGWYDKRWMYEESLRMPLLARWPGRIEPQTRVSALVQNIDFAPTFLDLAGVKPPADLHGRSLAPLLQMEAPPWRESIYYHYYESRAEHRVPAHDGVRTHRYKLIHFYEPEHNYWELFDLQRDPREMRSVAADPLYADVAAELKSRLVALRDRYGVEK